MNRIKLFLTYLLLIAALLVTNNIFPHDNESGLRCTHILNKKLQTILISNPNRYTVKQIDDLIEVSGCFNELFLPTLSITLLTDERFIPSANKLTSKQKTKINYLLAQAYQQLGKNDKAELYYKKVISQLTAVGNTDTVLMISLQLADLFIKQSKPEKAALYLSLVEKLSKDSNRTELLKCRYIFLKAEYFQLKNNLTKAVRFHRFAIDSLNSCSDSLIAKHMVHLVSLYTTLNYPDSAMLYLSSIGKDSLLDLSDYYLVKSALLRKQRNLWDATNFYKKYIEEVKKRNETISRKREKLLINSEAFSHLLVTIKPVNKLSLFNWTISVIFIIISLVILTALVFIILSQRKHLKRKRAELAKVKDEKKNILLEGEHLSNQENNGVATRLNNLKAEMESKSGTLKKLAKQLDQAKANKIIENKANLEINFQLRSLLSSILGYTGMFKTEFAKLKETNLYKYADHIEGEANRIFSMVETYKEYAVIDSGEVICDIKKINIVETIYNTIKKFERVVEQRRIKLMFNKKKMPLVFADEVLLDKILSIATEVAINNTTKGFVIIDLDISNKKRYCEVKIQNTGHGFDKAYLDDILEPFNRAGLNYIPGFNGTGMEYPLINKMAHLMKSKVKVDAKIEQGISFTLSVPVSKTLPPDDSKKSVQKKTTARQVLPWEGKRVLVVEDDTMNRLLFSKLLKGSSRLILCENGDKGLEAVGDLTRENQLFDIVLMDINLPDPWDGIKLKNRIQELFSAYKSIPFIAQTAYAMQGDRERFLSEGFNEYISKPILKNELIRAISSVIVSDSE